jgi:hypothetical protein
MKLLKLLIAVFILLTFGKAAYGCDCVPPDFDEAFTQADAVFTGKVVSIEGQKFDEPQRFHFKIDQFWKGVSNSEIALVSGGTFKTDKGTWEIEYSSCFMKSFVKGEKYLVFANNWGGNWIARTCSRTTKAANNEEDLKKLGKGKVLKQKRSRQNSLQKTKTN